MLTIFMMLGRTLADSGLTSSLIRSKNISKIDYSTVFIANLATSIVIYFLLFVAAPLIADFFSQPALILITRIYCLIIILQALGAVQLARFVKVFDFRSQTKIKIPANILAGAIGIWMAFRGYGVWSLVGMHLSRELMVTIQLWFYAGENFGLAFDQLKFKQHFSFGSKLALSGALDAIFSNIYHVLIGRYFSATQLGFYTRAQAMRQLPVANISTVLNKVTYPLFSDYQDDNVKLKSFYRRLMVQVIFWLAPVLTIGALLGEPLFRFLLTDKWLPAVPYFQILCIVGVLYPIQAYNLNILKVKGRSDLFLKLEVVKKITVVFAVAIGINYGIYGLLWANVTTSIIALFINAHYSGTFIDYSLRDQLKDVGPILLLAVVIAIPAFYIDSILITKQMGDFWRLCVVSSIYFVIYLLISSLVKTEALRDFKYIILQR